jgi:hypothetical protein
MLLTSVIRRVRLTRSRLLPSLPLLGINASSLIGNHAER